MDVLDSVNNALTEAEKIGYPVMLKARSGGKFETHRSGRIDTFGN